MRYVIPDIKSVNRLLNPHPPSPSTAILCASLAVHLLIMVHVSLRSELFTATPSREVQQLNHVCFRYRLKEKATSRIAGFWRYRILPPSDKRDIASDNDEPNFVARQTWVSSR